MPDEASRSRRFTLPFLVAIAAAAIPIGVAALLVNIFQRQQEAETFTERQDVTKQPGTCMHCHASVYGHTAGLVVAT